jgi:hypothetical protein
MFVQNAVPMTNGILMSRASSITYFVMSIITLIFLFGCHEAASYMLLRYHPYITFFYGLVLLALGIVCMIIDVGGASADADIIWATMSVNQKAFFGKDVENLQAVRQQNTLFAGLFGLSLGGLIIIQAILVFILKRAKDEIEDQNIEWAPSQMKSRSIQKMLVHEKCSFPYIKMPEDKHMKVLGVDKKKKKGPAGYDDDNQTHDGYSFYDEMDEMDYDIVDANEEDDPYQEANQYGGNDRGNVSRDGYDDD